MHAAPQPVSQNPEPAESFASAWAAIAAGLIAALVAAFLFRPARPAQLTFLKASSAAVLWVGCVTLAGSAAMAVAAAVLGQRFVRSAAHPALDAAVAWALIPPLLLLVLHQSLWALLLAVCAAAAVAVSLRDLHPAAEAPPMLPAEPFAELPRGSSRRGRALLIALCIEAAAVFLLRRLLLAPTLLLGVASFLFTEQLVTAVARRRRTTLSAARFASAALLALLILIPLLLARFGPGGSTGEAARTAAKSSAHDAENPTGDAYQGIILWPVPPKNDVVLPPLPRRDFSQTAATKPLIIPFDGAYWYFQAPHQSPGLHAHFAHASPIAVSIFSENWLPLAMQAHQTLVHPVNLAQCGRLRVEVQNGDNRPGIIDLGVVLSDSTLPGKPSLYLGAQPIVSTEPGHFSAKPVPIDEDVTFAIASHPTIRQFDQITVLFFPSIERATLGARIGIRQFELVPR